MCLLSCLYSRRKNLCSVGVLSRGWNETQLTLCEPWIMLINKLHSNHKFVCIRVHVCFRSLVCVSVWLLPQSYLYTQFIQQVLLVSGVQIKKLSLTVCALTPPSSHFLWFCLNLKAATQPCRMTVNEVNPTSYGQLDLFLSFRVKFLCLCVSVFKFPSVTFPFGLLPWYDARGQQGFASDVY